MTSCPPKEIDGTVASSVVEVGETKTVNYRPLPPTTFVATGAQTDFCDTGNAQWRPQLRRVRFGDILGLHSDSGQLSALHPTKQAPRWEMAALLGARGEGDNGAEGGKFEIHPACECSKQRAFSGAVRQVSIRWFALCLLSPC